MVFNASKDLKHMIEASDAVDWLSWRPVPVRVFGSVLRNECGWFDVVCNEVVILTGLVTTALMALFMSSNNMPAMAMQIMPDLSRRDK